VVLGRAAPVWPRRRADDARHPGGDRLLRDQHRRRGAVHGRRPRHRAGDQQRLRRDDQLRAGADPDVPADGRAFLPYGAGDEVLQCRRQAARQRARPARVRDSDRRHGVRRAGRLEHGSLRAARLADGAGDDAPGLQQVPVDRADHGGRRPGGDHPALGALSVIVLAACYGEMTWKALVKSLNGALRLTVMAFLIIFGSATFAQVLAFTGASSGLMNWALGFNVTPLGMLFVMIGVILFLGCFMDQLSMMLLTAPIFFPLAKTLGFDLTWFGLIMLLALEIGYTTPPFGLLLFVMKGVSPPGTTMRDIYLAGMPFIACVLLLIGMIIIFPPLATWLPAMSH